MRSGLGARWGWEVAAAAALLVSYGVLLWAMPKEAFWHPDEGGKFIQMESLRWRGGLEYEVPYRGAKRDPQLDLYPGRCAGKRVYPQVSGEQVNFQWPIWFPLLTRPLFEKLGMTGLYLLPLGGAWLTAVLAGLLVRPRGSPLAALTILLTGLATPVVFYGLHFLEHTLATALGMAALCLAVGCGAGRARGWLAALLLLPAVALRVEMLIFAAALAAGWPLASLASGARSATEAMPPRRGLERFRLAVRPRHVVTVVVALLVAGALVFSLAPRHLEDLAELPELLGRTRRKLRYLPDSLLSLLVNAGGFGAARVTRGSEIITFAAILACLAVPFLRHRRLESALSLLSLAVIAQFSAVIILLSYAYSARQGILVVAPYLVIALYALPEAWRSRDLTLSHVISTGVLYFLLSVIVIFVTRIGYEGNYVMGLEGAARYLLPLYPLWTALSVVALSAYRSSDRPPLVRSTFTLLVIVLMMLALVYQARGVRTLVDNRRTIANWQRALPGDVPVVTDAWWLAACVAPYFTRHEMYCIASPGQLASWVAFAQAHDLTEFVYARREQAEALQPAPEIGGLERESERSVDGLRITRFRLTGERGL